MAVLGIPDGALGVLWPSIRHTFGLPVGDLGILAIAGTALYFTGGLATGRIVGALGTGRGLLLAAALATAGAALWTGAPVWIVLVVAIAVFGFARGMLDAAVNAVASVSHGVGRLGLLHATYGVGAALGPVLTATIIAATGTWRAVVGFLCAVLVVLLFEVWSVRQRWPALPSNDAGDPNAGTGHGLVVTATLTVFTLYTAAEGAVGAWVYTMLREGRHLAAGRAAATTALFWIAFTGGRFAVAVFGDRFRHGRGLNAGAIVAAAALAALWLGPRGAEVVALPVAGLGFAPAFPVLMALMPERVGPARAATVVGWSIAAAAVGGPVCTALLGVLADRAGTAVLAPGLFAASVAYAAGLGGLTVAARRLRPRDSGSVRPALPD